MAHFYLLLATLIVFVTASPVSAASRFRLASNQLTVVLEIDRRYPVVAVGVRYPISPEGRGLEQAHALCYLGLRAELFQGRSFIEALDPIGASDVSATANPDAILYSTTVPTNQLPQLLRLESKRMRDPLAQLDTQRFEELRLALVESYRDAERHRSSKSSPFRAGHRYHRLSPSPALLENMTLDELRSFQRRVFTPQHAELTVIGDFSIATALSQIQATFGALPLAPSTPPHLGSSRETPGGNDILDTDPSTPSSITWQGPGIADEDAGAIEIFAHALGTRLQRVNTKTQVTIRFFQDASILRIAGFADGRLHRFLAPFENTEIRRAVDALRRRRFLDVESVAGRVRARQSGLGPKPGEHWTTAVHNRYPRVDNETIAEIVKRYTDLMLLQP